MGPGGSGLTHIISTRPGSSPAPLMAYLQAPLLPGSGGERLPLEEEEEAEKSPSSGLLGVSEDQEITHSILGSSAPPSSTPDRALPAPLHPPPPLIARGRLHLLLYGSAALWSRTGWYRFQDEDPSLQVVRGPHSAPPVLETSGAHRLGVLR
ncbi:unnamed protein product [Arctogadus glacialis]